MSGAGKRRRGRGRGNQGHPAETPKDKGTVEQYDGPSDDPRGRVPAPGSVRSPAMSPGRNSPSAGPRSPRMASPTPQAGMGPASGAQGSIEGVMAQPMDPARDVARVSRYTDMCKNLDLPAEAYSLDKIVSTISSYSHLQNLNALFDRIFYFIFIHLSSQSTIFPLKPLKCEFLLVTLLHSQCSFTTPGSTQHYPCGFTPSPFP